MAHDDQMLRRVTPDELWVQAIDGWTAYMRAGKRSELTIRQRRWQVRSLAGMHQRRSPWSLTTTEIVEWLAAKDWSAETRKSFKSGMNVFYTWAIITGQTKRNPAKDLPVVTVPPAKPRPTPDRVVVRALTSATDRDRLILMLAANAGLRRAEIAGLRWDHMEDGAIWVEGGKGDRNRIVPLHPALVEQLGLERDRRRSGQLGTGWRYSNTVDPASAYMFPGTHGGHIRADSLGKAASKALGGHGWTAHTLRHRFATRGYAGTRDLFAGQAALGHSKPETTKRYTDVPADAMLAFVQAAGM